MAEQDRTTSAFDSDIPAFPSTGVEFRLIPGFPGYCADRDASIWSRWDKRGSGQLTDAWHRLKPHRRKCGHDFVRVKVGGDKKCNVGVHRLVCLAYHGVCPDGMECRHKNGIPHDNHPDNIAWGTRTENIHDAIRHGTFVRGERSKKAKVTEDIVREIRRLHATGNYTLRQLGEQFGLAGCTIYQIVARKNWAHVA